MYIPIYSKRISEEKFNHINENVFVEYIRKVRGKNFIKKKKSNQSESPRPLYPIVGVTVDSNGQNPRGKFGQIKMDVSGGGRRRCFVIPYCARFGFWIVRVRQGLFDRTINEIHIIACAILFFNFFLLTISERESSVN